MTVTGRCGWPLHATNCEFLFTILCPAISLVPKMGARMIIMTRFCRCSGSRGWGEAAD